MQNFTKIMTVKIGSWTRVEWNFCARNFYKVDQKHCRNWLTWFFQILSTSFYLIASFQIITIHRIDWQSPLYLAPWLTRVKANFSLLLYHDTFVWKQYEYILNVRENPLPRSTAIRVCIAFSCLYTFLYYSFKTLHTLISV